MNDLVGLQYKWGANPDVEHGFTDCFQLFCAVRRRLGLHDYVEDFTFAYEQYDEASFCFVRMARWMLSNAREIESPRPGCLAMMKGRAALATMTPDAIICIAPKGRSVKIPLASKQHNLRWFCPEKDA